MANQGNEDTMRSSADRAKAAAPGRLRLNRETLKNLRLRSGLRAGEDFPYSKLCKPVPIHITVKNCAK